MASVKKWICGRLGYNNANDRYGLLINDIWEDDGFHCGEGLQVHVNDEWVDTRFKMAWTENGNEWYLVGIPYRGDAIEYVQARNKKWIEDD